MAKPKIAAIIPALNEEKNIGRVLEIALQSKELDEVIVVDGGSTDKTVEVAQRMGARVIIFRETKGKGEAMWQGVKSTDAEIIIFFDADLIGLSLEHIHLLLEPILEDTAVMTVGLRERWLNLPGILAKIDPLSAIGGERAMKRFIFEEIPKKFIQGFMVETALNYYCKVRKLPAKFVKLKNLDIVIKEKKWGLFKGFLERVKMIFEIFKIRTIILLNRKVFAKNV